METITIIKSELIKSYKEDGMTITLKKFGIRSPALLYKILRESGVEIRKRQPRRNYKVV
jgi:acyl CoA:acetate/3-ketoacid CoA transferase alpha subunit